MGRVDVARVLGGEDCSRRLLLFRTFAKSGCMMGRVDVARVLGGENHPVVCRYFGTSTTR